MFDLPVVQDPCRDAAFGREAFEEVDPLFKLEDGVVSEVCLSWLGYVEVFCRRRGTYFRPFPISRHTHGTFIRLDGDGELVSGHEIEGTLGEAVVDLGEDLVLFLGVEINW